jgi:tetratricopeptide (TPR) repeat protein
VGLTQLQQIPAKLMGLAAYFQSGLHSNPSVTLVIVLNAMVFGFFTGYLLTRMFLAGAFSEADRAAATLLGAEQFAQGLTEAKAYRKAISTLEDALKEVGPDTPKEVKRKIYESLAYNYLYEEPPVGFQKVIEYGRAYVTQEPDTPSARIWAYLAAAYGQQYSWESKHDKRQGVLDEARKNALEAIQNALKLEPKIKPLLKSMWDPNDATKEPTEENDLEVFYDDPEFKKLLS